MASTSSNTLVGEGVPAVITGGVDSCSQIQSRSATGSGASGIDPWIAEHKPELYLPMIETPDITAQRYGIRREAGDRFSVESQRKTAETQAGTERDVTVDADTSNRPGTTYESDKQRLTLAAGLHACESLPRHPPERPRDLFEGPPGLVRPQTV